MKAGYKTDAAFLGKLPASVLPVSDVEVRRARLMVAAIAAGKLPADERATGCGEVLAALGIHPDQMGEAL